MIFSRNRNQIQKIEVNDLRNCLQKWLQEILIRGFREQLIEIKREITKAKLIQRAESK